MKFNASAALEHTDTHTFSSWGPPKVLTTIQDTVRRRVLTTEPNWLFFGATASGEWFGHLSRLNELIYLMFAKGQGQCLLYKKLSGDGRSFVPFPSSHSSPFWHRIAVKIVSSAKYPFPTLSLCSQTETSFSQFGDEGVKSQQPDGFWGFPSSTSEIKTTRKGNFAQGKDENR